MNLKLGVKSDVLLIKTSVGEISADDVSSVWYRRPKDPVIYDGVHNMLSKELAFLESKMIFNWLWEYFSKAFWVNIPRNNKLASNKLLQMKTAIDFGFRVPDSIITNNPQEAEDFFNQTRRSGGKTDKWWNDRH